ncbi:lipopolysaccharide assembly protein LapA domain-containing protein [Actinomadura alba]|uniref:DUF1049 domain-containing protein n=1 Tax=Actinomadura alba TaxID=406431 RepID=A0ABR7LYA8_9ACTN|nr:lipopolysaccharide assembly protein LapA domain-containing protein [Actinomadura alba]MBC6469529.1 DUF1049 domain-containing protein [Actinomadura alba]
MFLFQRTRNNPDQAPTERDVQTFAAARRISHARMAVVRLGVCAAILLGALIAFMVQNTVSVKVSFLWAEVTLPLAIALLLAMLSGVGGTFGARAASTARRRRLARKRAN